MSVEDLPSHLSKAAATVASRAVRMMIGDIFILNGVGLED